MRCLCDDGLSDTRPPRAVERKASRRRNMRVRVRDPRVVARAHEERPELVFIVAHALVRGASGRDHVLSGSHDAHERLDLVEIRLALERLPLTVVAPLGYGTVAQEGENFWKMLRVAVHEDGAHIVERRLGKAAAEINREEARGGDQRRP